MIRLGVNMKAFPSPHWKQNEYEGMDLRDYFAAKAMQAMLGRDGSAANIGQGAYLVADLMMEAREK